MRFFSILLWLFMASTTWAAPQESDIKADRAEIIRLLGQLPEVMTIREDLYALGFRGANLELAVKRDELIFRDPVLAGYIADQVIAVFETPEAMQQAGGLIWPLIRRGLGHLPTRELKFYYEVERSILKAFPTRQCGLFVRNRLSPERLSDLSLRIEAKMSTRTLREYYRIQAKAARLGVNRAPVRMSEADQARVIQRFMDIVIRSIARSENPEALALALVNPERATNARACTIRRLFMDVAMNFKGRELRETLVLMSLL